MKSTKPEKGTLVSVENITPFGIWLFIEDKEYLLNYRDYPYFRDQIISNIQNVQLLHGFHLYWPELDIDLELDNLERPDKYPQKDKAGIIGEKKSKSLYKAGGKRRTVRK